MTTKKETIKKVDTCDDTGEIGGDEIGESRDGKNYCQLLEVNESYQ